MLMLIGALVATLTLVEPPGMPKAPTPKAPDSSPSPWPRVEPAVVEGEDDGGFRPERVEWTVDGVKRELLVVTPKSARRSVKQVTRPAPVIFGFHGHGGTARYAYRRFAYHEHWPEAICVYMQGLPTPGRLTDPEGKRPGWQIVPGQEADRDLRFFDQALTWLRHARDVDERRVYAAGHSNGGAFTYLLWAERGDALAAVAPAAAGAPGARFGIGPAAKLRPKPAMHIAGRKDTLVSFDLQERTIDMIRRLNGCEREGKAWAEDCVVYPSAKGTPVVTMITDGGHEFPPEAPALIVRFFKEHARAAKPEAPRPEPTAPSEKR